MQREIIIITAISQVLFFTKNESPPNLSYLSSGTTGASGSQIYLFSGSVQSVQFGLNLFAGSVQSTVSFLTGTGVGGVGVGSGFGFGAGGGGGGSGDGYTSGYGGIV